MKDSVAPNEYSVPTNVVLPGRMTQIGATPGEEEQRDPRRLEPWVQPAERLRHLRYVAIEYVIREAPITPAFVAMKRIVEARIPT